jgi:hypothetical protein
MIKPREAFAARPCENIHKRLPAICAPVCTGRVVIVVPSRI